MRFRLRVSPVVPLVLLVVDVLEQIAEFEVKRHVHDTYKRTAIIVVLIGLAFTIGANLVAPTLTNVLHKLRKESASAAGRIGLWAFYGLAYGAIYYVFLVIDRFGPQALLPASLR
jgi:hypothetical protein